MIVLLLALFIIFGVQSIGWFLYIFNPGLPSDMDFLSYGASDSGAIFYLLVGAAFFVFGYKTFAGKEVARDSMYLLDELKSSSGNILLLGPMLAVLFILFSGAASIPSREGYHVVNFSFLPSFLISISGIAGLLALPLLGLTFAKGGKTFKLLSIVLLLVLMVCYFSKASRILAFAPLAFWGMAYAISGKGKIFLAISFVIAPVFVHIVLASRGQLIQGFMPFLEYAIYDLTFGLGEVLWSALSSLAGPYFIFSETLIDSQWQVWSDISISLNPDFGVRAGWYEVSDFYRVNRFVPYCALGEVFAYSLLFGCIYCFLLGALLARLSLRVRRREFLGYLMLAIYLYACVLIPQYNLRSVMRFVYMVAFLELIILVVGMAHHILVKKESVVSRRDRKHENY